MCSVLQAATSSDQTQRKNAENTLKQACYVAFCVLMHDRTHRTPPPSVPGPRPLHVHAAQMTTLIKVPGLLPVLDVHRVQPGRFGVGACTMCIAPRGSKLLEPRHEFCSAADLNHVLCLLENTSTRRHGPDVHGLAQLALTAL